MRDARRQVLDEPYPMVRVNDRVLEPEYAGPVFVWDIDRTYLDTRFSELKGLVGIPFEFGIDKREIPGTAELLRALRRAGGDVLRPLQFLSASPPQIAYALERKMLLDGVEWDGITYKDPLRLLLRGEPRQLREQIAFKLSALVRLASDLPPGARMHLFGDDVESDPLIFALAADLLAGRLRGERLERVLVAAGAKEKYARAVAHAADALPRIDRVEGCYIRLDRAPGGETVRDFDDRVIGWTETGALADVLVERGLLGEDDAQRVRAASPPGVVHRGRAARDPDGFRTPRERRALQ